MTTFEDGVKQLCCSLCTFDFLEKGMKLTVQLYSGLVWFPLTFYSFFVVTPFACAHPEWVEVTPSPSHLHGMEVLLHISEILPVIGPPSKLM